MREDARTRAEWAQARSAAHAAALPSEPVPEPDAALTGVVATGLVATETVPVAEAVGRVLARDLPSLRDVPAAASSAMDGWAVCGAGPWRLAECGGALNAGEAATVATGDAVPTGARAVLRRERGVVGDGILSVAPSSPDAVADGLPSTRAAEPVDGADIRQPGEEARAGAVLIAAGAVLNPARTIAASICGYDELEVAIMPAARILLVGETSPALDAQLPVLWRMLGLAPGAPVRLADDTEVLARTLVPVGGGAAGGGAAGGSTGDDGAPGVTIVVGGIGRGQSDGLRDVLRASGGEFLVDGVSMRPGSPTLLVRMPDGRLVAAFPGTPMAAVVGMSVLLAPLVAGLHGLPLPEPGTVRVAEDVHDGRGRARMLPYVMTPHGALQNVRPGAGLLRGMGDAVGLLVVPPEGVPRGAIVPTLPLPWTSDR